VICAEAGLTTGALYAHFGSKEGLLREVYRDYVFATLEQMDRAVREAEGGGMAIVADRFVRENDADPTWTIFGVEIILRAFRDEKVRAELSPVRRAARDRLAGLLTAEAQRRGITLPMPAEYLATVLRTTANGMALERLVDAGGAPIEAFATFLSFLFDLMEAAASAKPSD
jgi:AcrR family transcriptional regulator